MVSGIKPGQPGQGLIIYIIHLPSLIMYTTQVRIVLEFSMKSATMKLVLGDLSLVLVLDYVKVALMIIMRLVYNS